MKLEHWTDVPNLTVIDPSHHGKGVSGEESKRKRNSPHNWVDRSYHYLAGTTPESMLGAKAHVYTSDVPDEKIYDYQKDPANLRAKSMWGQSLDHNEYEKNIKEAGYLGYINHGAEGMGHAVALFHPVKPISHTGAETFRKSATPAHDHPDLPKILRGNGQLTVGELDILNNAVDESDRLLDHDLPDDVLNYHETFLHHAERRLQNSIAQSGRPKLTLAKGKNARAEKRRIFGSDPNAPRLSPKRRAMMLALRALVEKRHGIDMTVAAGKRDTSGQLRDRYASETHAPYDVFTPEGQKEEATRQKMIDLANEEMKAQGKKAVRRTDPKPDWRSGKLETQPSPDAAAHEIAHLYNEPEGQNLGEMQTRMDQEWGESQTKYGHLQQKKTRGEIQPMSLENPIRRRAGIPATAPYKNPAPMSEHGRPVEQAVDDSGPRFHRGVKPSNPPQSVDYDRSSRLMSPETQRRLDQIDRGELQFDKERGWVPGTSPDAKINIRARAAAEDPNPETNFARKDRDTLLRSMTKSAPSIRRMREMLRQMKTRAQGGLKKETPGLKLDPAGVNSLKNAFGGGSSTPPPPPPAPTSDTGSLGGNIAAGLGRLMGKSKGCGSIEILRKLAAMKKAGKWPVPGLVPPSGDKGVGGQHPMKKADEPIGQTQSGKPIHSDHAHPAHGNFSEQDHADAMKAHEAKKQALYLEPRTDAVKARITHHRNQAFAHNDSRYAALRARVDGAKMQKQTSTPPPPPSIATSGVSGGTVNPSAAMSIMTSGGFRKSDADDQRIAAYAKKPLGAFANGKMLHNTAAHPDHAKFDMLDHMRATAIHTKMANEAEKNKQYLESAHHRKQAAHHRAQWKANKPSFAGSLYKSMMDATRNKGANPMRDGLNTGEPTAAEKKSLAKEDKKPKLEVVPHPEEVIDVDPEILHHMERRLNPDRSNALKLVTSIRALLSGPRREQGEPPYIDQAFKDKLNGILKKAQYAKTGDPEDRKKALKEEKVKSKAMKKLGEQLRRDTIKYLKNQKGQALASENPGSKDRAKSTRRNLKDVKPGEQLNKPE